MSAADWPPERTNQLKILWAQGFSASQIAKQLGGGLTRNAVIGKRIRMGLPGHASPNREYTRKRRPANQRPTNIVAVKAQKPKQPSPKPEPWKEKGARQGPNNVRFVDRSPSQCPMFVCGQEGAHGLVCGKPADAFPWCAACAQLVFMPTRPAIAAPREAA